MSELDLECVKVLLVGADGLSPDEADAALAAYRIFLRKVRAHVCRVIGWRVAERRRQRVAARWPGALGPGACFILGVFRRAWRRGALCMRARARSARGSIGTQRPPLLVCATAPPRALSERGRRQVAALSPRRNPATDLRPEDRPHGGVLATWQAHILHTDKYISDCRELFHNQVLHSDLVLRLQTARAPGARRPSLGMVAPSVRPRSLPITRARARACVRRAVALRQRDHAGGVRSARGARADG